jgi:type II secretory pathway pseudopilin PulG
MDDLVNTRRYNETGDTLLEIVIAIVLIGLVVSAYLATYSTQGTASTAQRALATGDGVLRSYAEATKSAVRTQCTSAGATFTVNYTPPSGFSVNALGVQNCPPATTPPTTITSSQPWPPIALTVTMPSGQTRSLSIVVRSPVTP